MRRAAFASLGFVFLAVTLSACSPAGELRGLAGEKSLTFAAKNEKKYIRVENVSNIAGELGESYIVEGGVRKETSFKVIAGIKSGTYEPCKFPTSGEQLEKKGD
ncbi:MAG TPA: hypothetical protein VFS26_08225, partial [Solirubrobacterales bacterium]|nr:hypothetical protein [Solirubrobacterales bacterium]